MMSSPGLSMTNYRGWVLTSVDIQLYYANGNTTVTSIRAISIFPASPPRRSLKDFDQIVIHSCLWTSRNRIESERLDTLIPRLPTRAATDITDASRRAKRTSHAFRSCVAGTFGARGPPQATSTVCALGTAALPQRFHAWPSPPAPSPKLGEGVRAQIERGPSYLDRARRTGLPSIDARVLCVRVMERDAGEEGAGERHALRTLVEDVVLDCAVRLVPIAPLPLYAACCDVVAVPVRWVRLCNDRPSRGLLDDRDRRRGHVVAIVRVAARPVRASREVGLGEVSNLHSRCGIRGHRSHEGGGHGLAPGQAVIPTGEGALQDWCAPAAVVPGHPQLVRRALPQQYPGSLLRPVVRERDRVGDAVPHPRRGAVGDLRDREVGACRSRRGSYGSAQGCGDRYDRKGYQHTASLHFVRLLIPHVCASQ